MHTKLEAMLEWLSMEVEGPRKKRKKTLVLLNIDRKVMIVFQTANVMMKERKLKNMVIGVIFEQPLVNYLQVILLTSGHGQDAR